MHTRGVLPERAPRFWREIPEPKTSLIPNLGNLKAKTRHYSQRQMEYLEIEVLGVKSAAVRLHTLASQPPTNSLHSRYSIDTNRTIVYETGLGWGFKPWVRLPKVTNNLFRDNMKKSFTYSGRLTGHESLLMQTSETGDA